MEIEYKLKLGAGDGAGDGTGDGADDGRLHYAQFGIKYLLLAGTLHTI